MNIDIYSVIALFLVQLTGGQPMGTATGFLWKEPSSAQYYLITNYHVLSGKHPITGQVVDPSGKVPTSIRVFQNTTKPGSWKAIEYALTDKHGKPKWREHPKFGTKVDVVALPIDLPTGTKGYAINDQKWEDLQLRPAEAVSIVGFPKGQTASGMLGIWQTGYVASEPEIDFDGLPALLVDSSAWPGNSGSPVIARRYGSWSLRSGEQGFGSGGGYVTDFVGVYSGQLGDAQMKFVWKRSVIQDLVK